MGADSSSTWTRTTDEGHVVTVTVDALGAAVSVDRIDGGRDGWTLSLDEFEEEWLPWLSAPFDDAADDIRAAVDAARDAADDRDDHIP